MNEIQRKFLINSDDTGRFIVVSRLTGIKYFVEPVGTNVTGWGDMVPGSGLNSKMTGKYGQKHRGAVRKEESVVNEENGFQNVTTLEPGVSPLLYIDRIDQVRHQEMLAR